MYNTSVADIEAIIFDLGGTIFSLPLPLFDYHRKFLREVNGHDFQTLPQGLETELRDGDEVGIGLLYFWGGG